MQMRVWIVRILNQRLTKGVEDPCYLCLQKPLASHLFLGKSTKLCLGTVASVKCGTRNLCKRMDERACPPLHPVDFEF